MGAMKVWSIVVAAGSGSRFGGFKQIEPLGADRIVVDWAVASADAVSDGVVVVVATELADNLRTRYPAPHIHVVEGAETRSGSVRAGLAIVPDDTQVIVVHDGARPLAEAKLFGRVIAAVRDGAAGAITAVPVTDTIRSMDGEPVDRESLRAVQTPQAFWANALREAHTAGHDATDDASLVEANGGRVVVVDGDRMNIKITEPEDLIAAAAVLESRNPQPAEQHQAEAPASVAGESTEMESADE